MDFRKLDFREQLLVSHITQFVKDSIDTSLSNQYKRWF